jgi:hypothetical protein
MDAILSSPILDIAITLIFIYFILGLIISSINEIIMSWMKKRQNLLKYAIEELVFDEHWKDTSQKLIASPFIQALKKKKDHFPAYIPSRNFAQALVDVIRNNKETPLTTQGIREILADKDSPIQGEAKKLLLGFLDEADNDLKKFRDSIEKFYDDAMDRANGWYKKYVRGWIFALSLTLSVSLNIDTILIIKRLWQDPSLAKQSANLVESKLNNMKMDSTTNVAILGSNGDVDTLGYIKNISTENAGDRTIGANVKSVKLATATIRELPLPIGWEKGNRPCSAWDITTKITGWLLTSLALMLGAPFWFDLLNKAVNLRSVGKRPMKNEDDETLTKK